MSEVNRRDAAKLAAALAIGAAGTLAAAQEVKNPTAPPPDKALAWAAENPSAHMLGKPVTVRLGGDGYTHDLVITSALGVDGKPTVIRLRPGNVAIFRADAGVDEFTKGGGLRWQFFGKPGEAELASPGAVVMVLHDWDDTARFYTMHPDFRC
jgi:hypothetical protein